MTIAPFPYVLRRSYQQHQGARSQRHNGAASRERLLEADPVTAAISRGRLGTCEWLPGVAWPFRL